MAHPQSTRDHTPFLQRMLHGLVRLSGRHPWVVLVIGFSIAAVSLYSFTFRLEYRTQRSDLMSPDKSVQQRLHRYIQEFCDDDDMVVVLEGSDATRLRAAIEEIAAAIGRQPERFDRLFYKVDLRHLRDRALLLLPLDQILSIQANLRSMKPLLQGPLAPLAWRGLTLLSLLRQAHERVDQWQPGRSLDQIDEQFINQLLAVIHSATATLRSAADYRSPWESLLPNDPRRAKLLDDTQYFLSGDGRLASLIVHPLKDVDSFTPAQASVQALREIVAATRARYPEIAVGVTGIPVLENDEMEASQSDSNRAGWLALGGVALLYMAVYRGLRCPLLTVSTLLLGTCWAMGWLTITVGHLNILSSTFAVMLIGMGDYGVLFVTQYEEERAAGLAPLEAIGITAERVGPSILTAASTTALAFFATMLADFQAVAELGWIAGCGVLLCAVACFTALPALILLTDRRQVIGDLLLITSEGQRQNARVHEDVLRARQPLFLPRLMRHPRVVICCGLTAILLLAFGAFRATYDHNLLHLQAHGLDSVFWERQLIDRTAGASWCSLSMADSRDEALALKARLEQLPEVSRVAEVASLVPADQPRKLEALRDIQNSLRNLPALGSRIQPFSYSPGELKHEITVLIEALGSIVTRSPDSIFSQLLGGLAELRDHPLLTQIDQSQARLMDFGTRLASDLLGDLHQLRSVAKPEPIAIGDLPASMRERFIGRTGKWLVQAYARDDLWELEPLSRFVRQIRSIDPEATGKPFATLEGLHAMRQGFAWAGVYAFAVIVLVLLLDFRGVAPMLLALFPLLAGVLVTLGLMGFFGWPLNPANMIALPLIVGVGVENGVHVVHDFKSRDRRRAYALARTTGQGITVAGLTTVLGFGTLMISRHQGLASLGLVLTVGVTACMVVALVVLPALLNVFGARRTEPAPTIRRAA